MKHEGLWKSSREGGGYLTVKPTAGVPLRSSTVFDINGNVVLASQDVPRWIINPSTGDFTEVVDNLPYWFIKIKGEDVI